MKKNYLFSGLLLLASLCLAVISFIFLPDTVVTQLSLNAEGATTMPKVLAVALPTLLGTGGAIGALFVKEDKKRLQTCRIVSVVGLLVFVLMLAVNH